MDEEDEEEKTGNIKRATHDDNHRSQPDHIPFDLTLEILSRLPAKSIVRCRCASKLWSSSTTLPSFISSFASRCSSRPPTLLVTLSAESKEFVFSFPRNQNPDGSYNSPVYSCQIISKPNYFYYQRIDRRSESVHGLFLFDRFIIWNPSLSRFSTLPHPFIFLRDNDLCMSYLGYDPLEDKHKVVCVSRNDSQQPHVLTLGAKESWRIITKGNPRHCPSGRHGRCFNGILYYRAHVDGIGPIMMSFDVKSEKFNPIKFPQAHLAHISTMSPYEGKLALVHSSIPFGEIDLYVLKDANGDEWTHKRFLQVPCKRGWKISLYFKGITDAGELVFAPLSVFETIYVLYFDPRRNTIREALFEGVVGEDFRHRYRITNNCFFKTTVFPNHIESLVSL